MREGRGDAAVSDVVGTLMMVGAVVLAGGLLTAVVTDTLSAPAAPSVAFRLAPVAVGDAALRLTLAHGDALPLADLLVGLQRGDGSFSPVPRADWATPHPDALRAGDVLRFPLDPSAAAGETLHVRVTLREPSATLASLSATTGAGAAALGAATLAARVEPGSLVADGVSAARLTVVVSHPAGAGAVARVVADLHALGSAAASANATAELNDAGLDGDALGGDGVWSTLVRAPTGVPVGTYAVLVNASDLDGRRAGATSVALEVVEAAGSVTGGTCYGCVVTGGVSAYEGTRLASPTSENISEFRLRNWTWDKLTPAKLRDDALVIRIVNGSAAWSMYFRFDHLDAKACMTYARAWTATNQTVYAPRNGTCLPLAGLDLDLKDPVASQQLSVVAKDTTAPNPHALYPSAGIYGNATFILAYLRDEDPTGTDELSQEIGLFSMDVVMS